MDASQHIVNKIQQLVEGERVASETIVESSIGVIFACVVTDRSVVWFPKTQFSHVPEKIALDQIKKVTLGRQPGELSGGTMLLAFVLIALGVAWLCYSMMDVDLGSSLILAGIVTVVGVVIGGLDSLKSSGVKMLKLTTVGGQTYVFNPYLQAKSFTAELRMNCIKAQEEAYRALIDSRPSA